MKSIVNNLKISKKLLAISLAFSLPIAVILFFMLMGYFQEIRFARSEILGKKTLEPMVDLISYTSDHRRLVVPYIYMSSDTNITKYSKEDNWNIIQRSFLNDAERAAAKVDSAFVELDRITQRYKRRLDLNFENDRIKTVEELTKEWEDIRNNSIRLSSIEANSKYEDFENDLYNFFRYIADQSNLVLDPDLDTYYLMDISVQTLPELQGVLVETMLLGQHIALNNGESDAFSLELLENTIKDAYLDRIKRSVSVTMIHDKKIHGSSKTLSNVKTSSEQLDKAVIRMMNKLVHYSEKNGENADLYSENSLAAYSDFLKLSNNVTENNLMLWQNSFNELEKLLGTRIQSYQMQMLLAILSTIVALTLAILFVRYIARRITEPLRVIGRISAEIAESKIKSARELFLNYSKSGHGREIFESKGSKDELHNLFHSVGVMAESLENLILQMHKTGSDVSQSSVTIATSAKQLEATVSEQAASTNQVNATSQQISSTSREIADTMSNINVMAQDAGHVANSSMEMISEIKENMQSLIKSEISDKLQLINERTSNINQVITAITKVANLTNLLSLNASIEAEKAGEYGAGFAVVAREMRQLADQTNISALEIEEMIIEMQDVVKEGITDVEQYALKTKASSEKTSRISSELESLINQTQRLQPKIETVNSSVQALSEAAGQINEAMGQLNDTALQNRDSLHEFNDIVSVLNESSNMLKRQIMKFDIAKKGQYK